MGMGLYSTESRTTRYVAENWENKSVQEIFNQRGINKEMNPKDVAFREARDSDEHPNSVAVIIALDLTGSMGNVPDKLVRDGLPEIMDRIIQNGEKDPQVLFLGVGDHEVDNAPLQVGQFESNDEMLDKWLTTTWLEGGGGGNDGESYLLAWYFAAFHTETDCFEKRNRKGLLFTIGDEPTLKFLPGSVIKGIMGGQGKDKTYTAEELFEKANERYEVYHIHVASTWAGKDKNTVNGWRQMIGGRLIVAEDHNEVPTIIADLVGKHTYEYRPDNDGLVDPTIKQEEIIL